MPNRSPTLPALLLLPLALAASPAAAQDFRWEGRIEPGRHIEIKGVNGRIEARPASGERVEVAAVKDGRRDDPESVEIRVVEHDEGVTICAVYPTPRRAERPNECAPGSGGRMSVQDNDVEVDFTVYVPAGVDLVARTVNGGVEAEELRSDVVARTVNGDVRVSTSGHAEAQTVNGSIRASLGSADWDEDARFKTVNGSITLALPEGTGADVEVSTVNGGIDTDFPLTIRGRWGPRRASGTIGGGGPDLRLETVNGSIRLVRR